MQSTYHVHFGAGRLGLGLVVPLMRHYAADVPLAIFQRPRPNGKEELTGESLSLVVNEDKIMEFKCVTAHTTHVDIHKLLDQRLPLFVSTCDLDVLQAILSRTSSFSTSVGPCGFEDTIQGLQIAQRSNYAGPLRKVYLFENDGKRFKQLIEDELGSEPFDVIQVICDRICTRREILINQVRVTCEEFPGMAVIFPSQRTPGDNGPFKRAAELSRCTSRSPLPSLVLTRTNEEAQFYYQRKLQLLNGTHFTMAVLGYYTLQRNGYSRELSASRLLSEWKLDPRNIHLLRLAIQGQILRLMFDTPAEVLQLVHGTDNKSTVYLMTMEYVETTMRRIDSIPDTLGRVLNLADEANVRIKKERYLCSIVAWLKKTGVSVLVSDVMRFPFDDIVDTFQQVSHKFEALLSRTPRRSVKEVSALSPRKIIARNKVES